MTVVNTAGITAVDESCANNTDVSDGARCLPPISSGDCRMVPGRSEFDQPLTLAGTMYMSDSYESIQSDRIWLAPRVARWMPVKPALIERLNEQWESIVLPAGASPGDQRAPVVLGVHVRGTDTRTGHGLEFDFRAIDRYIAAHEACTIGDPCRRVVILLATDDTGYLNSTQQRYGGRVATQNGGDIQRSSGGAGVWESAVSNALALGEEVMMDTLLLARCDYVLRGPRPSPSGPLHEPGALQQLVHLWLGQPAIARMDGRCRQPQDGRVPTQNRLQEEMQAGVSRPTCRPRTQRRTLAEGSTYYQLVEYLSSHGVLFTMCEKYDNCSALARQGPGGADQPGRPRGSTSTPDFATSTPTLKGGRWE